MLGSTDEESGRLRMFEKSYVNYRDEAEVEIVSEGIPDTASRPISLKGHTRTPRTRISLLQNIISLSQ